MDNKITIVLGSNGPILGVRGLPKGWQLETETVDVICHICGNVILPEDIVDEDDDGRTVHYDCMEDEDNK